MRHGFALRYLKHNPGKLVELATLLGHESLDTTAVYTRPSAEELAADLEKRASAKKCGFRSHQGLNLDRSMTKEINA
jgi:integrase